MKLFFEYRYLTRARCTGHWETWKKKEGKSLGKFLHLQYIFTPRDSYFFFFLFRSM